MIGNLNSKPQGHREQQADRQEADEFEGYR
jgi:hypothetical protein